MGIIYKITAPSGKAYVGQTRRRKVTDRWRAHKNRAASNTGACRALNNAIQKYGWENMRKEVLEIVDDEKLNERERVWIEVLDTFNRGYNLTRGGDENPMLHQSTRDQLKRTLATPEAFAKRSKVIKDFHADPTKHAKWLEAHKLSHRTPEMRAKIRAKNKKEWNIPGERKRRGDAIRAALNTPEMKATRADRAARTKATKKAKRAARLSSGTTTSEICEPWWQREGACSPTPSDY